jgi:thioredoxin 1
MQPAFTLPHLPLSLRAPHVRSACSPSCAPARVPPPAAPLSAGVRMSLSTPYPPAPRHHADAAGRAPSVTELQSLEQFEAALAAAAAETVTALKADGTLRERPVLVVVEAYSRSCRACIGVKRVYEKVAEEHRAASRCYRFDAFAVPKLSAKLGLRAMPTFVLYKNGNRIDHFTAGNRASLEQHFLDNL